MESTVGNAVVDGVIEVGCVVASPFGSAVVGGIDAVGCVVV